MNFVNALPAGLQRILRRRSHYRQAFQGASGEAVLADLKRFCRAGISPLAVAQSGTVDPIATGVAIGRQEVFQRIAHHIHLDDAAIVNLKEQSDNDD